MASVALGGLVGTWVNTNPATSGIVKVVLTDNHGSLRVHLYGACHPSPCDWGEVAGLAYAASIAGGPAVAFTANYGFSFKSTIVNGHIEGIMLVVEDFSVFTDHSGRAAYFDKGTFKKA